MSFLTSAVESAILFFHLLSGNWALSIALFAIVLKIIMFPLQLYNYRQMRAEKKSPWILVTSLAQIPIFFAVYRALTALPALAAAHVAWPFAIVVALAAYAQQHFFPSTEAKPEMVRVMRFMPLVSLAVMVAMPAGLVLYYAISGVLNLGAEYAVRHLA